MIDNFIAKGSLLSIVFMVYTNATIMEAVKINKADPYCLNSPRILKNPLSILFVTLAIPCAIWPAIYIGLYEGWVVGIISWFILQIISALAVATLGVRSYIGYHFIVACIIYPIGYYLSITSLLK